MTQINRLQAALRTYLPWHSARLTFLALFLVALFRVETVNLNKLSSVWIQGDLGFFGLQNEGAMSRCPTTNRQGDNSVTLHLVVNGNAQTEPLDESEF